MSEIIWNEITEAEETIFKEYYKKEQSRSCEHSFANNLLWAPFYKTKYSIVENCLVFKSGREQLSVSFPLGKDKVKAAVDALLVYFKEQDKSFCMHMVTKEQFAWLEVNYPGKFDIAYIRDAADYIYESEKLISLSGKKLHGKRNHINNFIKNYPDYCYESITDANKEECLGMAEEWRVQNGCDEDPDKQKEFCVTLRALQNMEDMFRNCVSLEELIFGENFTTKSVIDMSGTFTSCRALKKLDLSNFDTSSVETMAGMFSSCILLEELDISSFDTTKVNNSIKDDFNQMIKDMNKKLGITNNSMTDTNK